MHYSTGHPVHVGDIVELYDRQPGRVVCVLDGGEFSDDFPRTDWAWLERGLLIRAARDALIHRDDSRGLRLLRPVGR